MARSSLEYLQMLQAVLPTGRAWTRDLYSDMADFLYGLAEEFNRLEERVDILLGEIDSRYADELLEEYERDYGVPEDGLTLASTEALRRLVLNAKVRARGRQDKAYFGEIANNLNLSILILEHSTATCGSSYCGTAF